MLEIATFLQSYGTAAVASLEMFAIAWLVRLWLRHHEEHKAELRALIEEHKAEIAKVQDERIAELRQVLAALRANEALVAAIDRLLELR